MTSLVIGMGEIGSALYYVLKDTFPTQVYCYDIKTNEDNVPNVSVDVLHICIPYSDTFLEVVGKYQAEYVPAYTIVHSTVPVGTCEKLHGTVFHSPVRGKHPDLVKGLKTYVKYLSYSYGNGQHAEELAEYFDKCGITVETVYNFKTTELMKLLELCRYGVYIAFAKEQERICEQFGLDYDLVVNAYEKTRNAGISTLGNPELCQPILYPFRDYVGGHCTVEDMDIMLDQSEQPLLAEAYKIARGTKVWDNCNVYPTAQIGKGCSIGHGSEIGHNVKIGNNVRIGAFTFIPEGVVIEDNVFIAPRVSFSNDKHPPSKKQEWGAIRVCRGAVIGMGAIILPGVVVGENAVIGAGAIVTKSVPDNEVWYGTAAYGHGKREEVYAGNS